MKEQSIPKGLIHDLSSSFSQVILIFSCEASLYKLKNGSLTDSALAICTFNATCRPLMKKLILQNVSHLVQGVQNLFSKQEMELSKQEMELFLPFPDL